MHRPLLGNGCSFDCIFVSLIAVTRKIKLSIPKNSIVHSENICKKGASGRSLLPQIEMLALLLNDLLQPLNLIIVIQTVDRVNIPPDQIHERLQKRGKFAGILGLNQ